CVVPCAASQREDLALKPAWSPSPPGGDRALRTLAESTGGKAFFPGSIRNMDHSLGNLQEVLHGRYFVAYRPAFFKRDGKYRTIDITARRSGRKLRVYARKGYYAR